MPFVSELLKHRSISIVGTEKNVGKTETLNYVLRQLKDAETTLSITSIGIDGEGIDQVSQTSKPEIILYPGMEFVTSEKHYFQKQLLSEIKYVDSHRTSLGRLITAKVITAGKVLLSGPAETAGLVRIIEQNKARGIHLTLIDGALSRLSLASPVVSDAIILATGAAYSIVISTIVKRMVHLYTLMSLPTVSPLEKQACLKLGRGIYACDKAGAWHDMGVKSTLMLTKLKERIFIYGDTLYASGVVTDMFLKFLTRQKLCQGFTLIVRDFTVLFLSPEVLRAYEKHGGKIKVLYATNLLAITINPVAPSGYTLDSKLLQEKLRLAIDKPIFNVRELC